MSITLAFLKKKSYFFYCMSDKAVCPGQSAKLGSKRESECALQHTDTGQ